MNERRMIDEEKHYEDVIAEESICISDNVVYDKPETLTSTPMHYCPGCGHGVAHRIIAEVIAELAFRIKQ
jgi:2-oxoglutarate ferredoxin oxidoreductase subunit beta